MDRDALRRWLDSPHKTWRWNDGARDAYRGVETSDEGLRWFRWSHRFADGAGGLEAESRQTWAEFDREGPREAMPPELRSELDAWVARHREAGIA